MTITMDGKPMHVSPPKNHQIQLTETWTDQTLEIHFGADIRVEETEQGLFVYRGGPLLFALPIKAEESILVERGVDSAIRSSDLPWFGIMGFCSPRGMSGHLHIRR